VIYCLLVATGPTWETSLPYADPISVAVVGAGAFGCNHARLYHQLEKDRQPVRLRAIVDQNSERAHAVANEFRCRAFGSVEQLLEDCPEVRAASVAVPTVSHVPVAQQLLQKGIDVLIEKPLAPSVSDADQLISTAKSCGRIVQVGHLERFNPAVRATIPLITKPMFFEVHRLSVFTPRSLDVDVVLDLMIHDLDIVLSFVNSPICEIRAAGLPILSDKVDIANVRLEFESGCVANFTASRVSTERVRKLRFFQPHQYISLDYGRQDVLVLTVGSKDGMPSANPEIKVLKPEVINEEPLRAELQSFLQTVSTREQPVVSLEDGRRALAAALEITTQIKHHAAKLGLQ